MSLKYEPASVPQHISAKWLFLNRWANLRDEARDGEPGRNATPLGSQVAASMAISAGRIVETMGMDEGRTERGPILSGAGETPVILVVAWFPGTNLAPGEGVEANQKLTFFNENN